MRTHSGYNATIARELSSQVAAGRSGTLAGRMSPRTTVPLPALRYWRVRRAMTQGELAGEAGLHWTSVSRIENGTPAEMPTVRRLAAALQVEPADLMAQPPEA